MSTYEVPRVKFVLNILYIFKYIKNLYVFLILFVLHFHAFGPSKIFFVNYACIEIK